MKSRHRRKSKSSASPNLPPDQGAATGNKTGWARTIVLGGGAVFVILVCWAIFRSHSGATTELVGAAPKKVEDGSEPSVPKSDTAKPTGAQPVANKDDNTSPDKSALGSFLEDFGKEPSAADESKADALTNAELEKRFHDLEKLKGEHKALVDRVLAWSKQVKSREYEATLEERERLLGRLDSTLAGLEKEMKRARAARPNDAVVQWLTGELLIFIGAEPELILPHLQNAQKSGLYRPRLLASLARTETEANQIPKAFLTASKALDGDNQDRYIWRAYGQAAFHVERYADVIERIDKAFKESKPDWAEVLRRQAVEQQEYWQDEQKRRLAEEKADDLPRVRIIVQHRRFARDPKGRASGTIENTGTGEFVVELFEDQAPASVANFLSLVSHQTYEGTRFHLAESAAVVAGGDPHSRTGDPMEDGTGGPGYVIPDEFKLPGARRHFRGSLSMVNTGPHTTGSQFFITLVPKHEMDGFFTVFGRVIKGLDVVDSISRGRTNRLVGSYGQIIPGDVLLRAEVIRKRPHEYRVLKEKNK